MLTHHGLIQGSVWNGQQGELPVAEPGQHAEGRLQGGAQGCHMAIFIANFDKNGYF